MGGALTAYEGLIKKYIAEAGVVAEQMIGKPCLTVNGKAFVAQHLDTVVFNV